MNIGRTFLLLGWATTFGILIWGFSQWEQNRNNPSPETQVVDGSKMVTLYRGWGGHFITRITINDHHVSALVDTGATRVAIPGVLADKLGLQRGISGISATANGDAVYYHTQIDRLRIGDIVLHDIAASILPGYEDDSVLLGMSALRQLEVQIRDNTMLLWQH